MLPFLKSRTEASASMPVETEIRAPDAAEYDTVDAIVDDLLHGLERKSRPVLKDAINSLIEHIQNLDKAQDKGDAP